MLYGKIYAIGDAVCALNSRGEQAPMTARAAIDEGTVVAENILRDIRQLPHRAYRHKNQPYVIPVGGKYAVAQFGGLVISGIFAWFIKGVVELFYLTSIMPPRLALKVWWRGLKIFIANDRLG